MTSTAMKADIGPRFNRWLERFSPPRQIADKPQALQDDAAALARIFLDHAPAEGWQDWFTDALRRLEAAMTTRSWPAPGEVVRACRAAEAPKVSGQVDVRAETAAVDMMIDWHQRFGKEMPGMGNPARTRKLIERGVLKDLGEARHKGFALSPDEHRQVIEGRAQGRMQPGWQERRHHVAVLARLWDVTEEEADFRAQERGTGHRPDMASNRVSDDLQGAA